MSFCLGSGSFMAFWAGGEEDITWDFWDGLTIRCLGWFGWMELERNFTAQLGTWIVVVLLLLLLLLCVYTGRHPRRSK